jgi:hypothetical protein
MSLSENPSPPTGNARPRRVGDGAEWPLVVMYGTGIALGLTGEALILLGPWSWKHAGFLLIAVGACIITILPVALEVLLHPWALQGVEQHYKHPRLLGLASVWAGMVVLGWGSVMFLQWPPSYAPVPFTGAIFLVGLGPLYAMLLFDRRR